MKAKKSIYQISVDTAAAYTQNWRKQRHESINYAKAFTVHLDELEYLVASLKNAPEANANAVRFYLAEKPSEIIAQEFKQTLVLVGVSGFDAENNYGGTDLVNFAEDEDAISGCYDFTYPCPDTCAVDSILLRLEGEPDNV